MRIIRPKNKDKDAPVERMSDVRSSERPDTPATLQDVRPGTYNGEISKTKITKTRTKKRAKKLRESSKLKVSSSRSAQIKSFVGKKNEIEVSASSKTDSITLSDAIPVSAKMMKASDLKSSGQDISDSSQISDGRKRRRSEVSDLSFFNTSAAKLDIDSVDIEDRTEDNLALFDDLASLFKPPDDKKKEFNRLLASGMRLLAMREHSVKEITTKLLTKTELPDVAYAVVDQLKEDKYLSDDRFAESFVRSRAGKGFGPIKIRAELKNRGITSQLISEYLNMTSASWFESARQQHYKKYGNAPVDSYRDWAKRARFMQSRGFTMEHIEVTLPERIFD